MGLVAEGGKEVGSLPAVQNFRPSVGDVCWAQFSCKYDHQRICCILSGMCSSRTCRLLLGKQ